MANTNRDLINSAMGGSQDPNQDDYQAAMGGVQSGGGGNLPNNVLAFSNGDHPVFSDGTYLRFAT